MEQTLDLEVAEAGLAFTASRPKSAASWGAIFAGACVAISTSLVLAALGTGLGLAVISPWADRGIGATSFTIDAAIWLIVMQWLSAGLGGYVAGRLRTRWIGTHPHERFFRDTATGLVTWSLATLVVAIVFFSSATSLVSGTMHAASNVASAGAQSAASGTASQLSASQGSGGAESGALSYGLDKLFRGSSAAAPAGAMEASHILQNALISGGMPDADRGYLATLIAAQTGLSTADAQRRVDDWVASAMQAEAKVKADADAARKAAAETAIYTALALVVGAFIAAVSAALGGRLRDEHV